MAITLPVALTWAEKMIALSTLASAIVLGLTALAVFASLAEAEKTRLASLIADISRRWDEDLVRRGRIEMAGSTPQQIKDLIEKAYHDPESRNAAFYDLQALANFLETLSVLQSERRGGLTIDVIDELYGTPVLATWSSWEPSVRFLRSKQKPPGTAYHNFEMLYQDIKERRDFIPG